MWTLSQMGQLFVHVLNPVAQCHVQRGHSINMSLISRDRERKNFSPNPAVLEMAMISLVRFWKCRPWFSRFKLESKITCFSHVPWDVTSDPRAFFECNPGGAGTRALLFSLAVREAFPICQWWQIHVPGFLSPSYVAANTAGWAPAGSGRTLLGRVLHAATAYGVGFYSRPYLGEGAEKQALLTRPVASPRQVNIQEVSEVSASVCIRNCCSWSCDESSECSLPPTTETDSGWTHQAKKLLKNIRSSQHWQGGQDCGGNSGQNPDWILVRNSPGMWGAGQCTPACRFWWAHLGSVSHPTWARGLRGERSWLFSAFIMRSKSCPPLRLPHS